MINLPKKQIIDIILYKSMYNLRSEASTNRLGYAWWVIEPTLHMLTFYLVFSLLLNHSGDDYVPFLFAGLIPWLWFTKTVNRSQGSILGGKQLMNQLHIPKVIFPLIVITQDLIKQVVIFSLLIVGLYLMGGNITIKWLWLIIIFVSQLTLVSGVSLLAAMAVPFFKDLRNLIPSILQFLMFSSGVFFDYNSIPSKYHDVFFLNPVAVFIKLYRDVMINNMTPDFYLLSYLFFSGLCLVVLSIYLINRFDKIYPRVVSE